MQAGKRCVRCNEINDPGRSYCVRCGKYLTARAQEQPKLRTVWECDPSDRAPDPVMAHGRAGGGPVRTAAGHAAPVNYVVVCPECGTRSPVTDGVIPLACGQCGYFFQAGVDLPVPDAAPVPDQNAALVPDPGVKRTADVKDTQKDSAPCVPPGGAAFGARRNPMARTSRDTSSLRLILISQPGVLPEPVGEQGGILGENGTLFRRIRSGQQISIWHSPAGWYARTLKGAPYYNGVPQSVGNQVRLEDGGVFLLEREQIRVEIT